MAEEMTLEMANKRVEELEKQMAEVMSRLGMKEEKPKKGKGKVEKVEKKKRGMTGYLLFAKEKRPEVKAELIANGNENPKPTEVITEVAKRWKAMVEEEQGEWNERAKTVSDDEA
jgi:hypothetical protein